MRHSQSLTLAQSIPSTINGWQQRVPDGVYNSETLYKYIDGAAELYRAFNVQTVVSRYYVKDNAPDIIVDIFDMGSSYDAFGVYHHSVHEGSDAGIGQNSEFIGTNLSFWKGAFYISIIGLGESEEVKRTIDKLGKSIADRINNEGALPDLLELLPRNAGQSQEIHYFHNHHCLNTYYFLADENLFNLDRQTEGVLGRYKEETSSNAEAAGSSFVVILLRYESAAKAKEALGSFLSGYLPDADGDGTAKTENAKWVSTQYSGCHIIGIFDAPSKEKTRSLLREIRTTLVKTFGEKEDK